MARSPNYPGIALEEAVAKVRKLYESEGTSPPTMTRAVEIWGLKPNTGQANVTTSALRKYDLISYEGKGSDRRAKLTDRALRIVRDDRADAPERDEAIRGAALAPALYRDLWAKASQGASDESLEYYLKMERDFGDSAVRRVVRTFRTTVVYAKLDASDTMSTDGRTDDDSWSDEDWGNDVIVQTPEMPDASVPEDQGASGTIKPGTISFPLRGGARVDIRWSGPLTEKQWTQFEAYLTTLKIGIVEDDTS